MMGLTADQPTDRFTYLVDALLVRLGRALVGERRELILLPPRDAELGRLWFSSSSSSSSSC